MVGVRFRSRVKISFGVRLGLSQQAEHPVCCQVGDTGQRHVVPNILVDRGQGRRVVDGEEQGLQHLVW